MKIALIGYGKMGKMIHEMAKNLSFDVVSIIDPFVIDCATEINLETLNNAEVCIEFSHPSAVLDNITQICQCKTNLVVGTTGWGDKLPAIRDIVSENDVGMIYGANLSIGMNLFYEIVNKTAEILANYPEYDAFGLELHHKQKADCPSGTAKELSKILLSKLKSKEMPVYDKLDRKVASNELHFASVRAGFIPGTHTVGFDSEADTIELTHRVRNRSGFALGALKAAQWIAGKKGLYTFSDYVRDNI
ncbi:MAG: 4-hydroxy-tetrahydrodipicolinate reductase [Candidatus Cloacimonetes bacterium]|nr:4-hydroxy-tetrahydrodipicolinate reductase [Candidatus Cloacimonadota bacterium]